MADEDKKGFDGQEYRNAYNKANYAEIKFRFRKDNKEALKELASKHNMSVNGLIIAAIKNTYNVDLMKDRK